MAKGRYNLSANKPILTSNSNTREITIDNNKLLQPITKPKGIHQPDNIIDIPTTTSPIINTLQDIITEDSKLPQLTSKYNNQFPYHTNSKDTESGDKDKDLANNNNQNKNLVNNNNQDIDTEEELN